MEYKYEYIFFKYIYEKLDLMKLDEKLAFENIKMYDVDNVDKRISKYFALMNKGTAINFSENDQKKYNYYFSKELDELLQEPLYSEVKEFVLNTYENYFFSAVKSEYMYYGPSSFEYMAPTDSIVLGINYVKFDIDSLDYDKELERQDGIIVDMLNYIQTDLASSNKIKLSAIAYNEISLNQPFKSL